MKVLAILLVLVTVLAGCGTLPTLTPEPGAIAPVPTMAPTQTPAIQFGYSVGYVNVRNADGTPTFRVLIQFQPVTVYATSTDGWCYIDPGLDLKVWCGCIGIGDAGCTTK